MYTLIYRNIKATKGNLFNNVKKRLIGYKVKNRDYNKDKVPTYYLALNNSRVLVIIIVNSF